MRNKYNLIIMFLILLLPVLVICNSSINIAYGAESEKETNISTGNSSVKIVYNPTVEINYVDESGKAVADSITIEGEENDTFEVSPKDISGYEPLNTIGKTKGIFGRDFKVTFVYKQNKNNGDNDGSNSSDKNYDNNLNINSSSSGNKNNTNNSNVNNNNGGNGGSGDNNNSSNNSSGGNNLQLAMSQDKNTNNSNKTTNTVKTGDNYIGIGITIIFALLFLVIGLSIMKCRRR